MAVPRRRAEKAVAEKKETLLEKARRLVTGKGGEKEAGKADEAPAAEEAEKAEKKAEKKAAPKAKAAKPAAPKAPKAKAEKKGGSTTRTPRKAGGA